MDLFGESQKRKTSPKYSERDYGHANRDPTANPNLLQESVEEPLAARMRPRSLADFAGQSHLVGEGGFLRRALELERQGKPGLGSIVFWGPPGTGKTTLALLLARESARRFVRLSAVLEGLKELRSRLEEYQSDSRAPILFIDEIHRWNKAQQDALLPWVESGRILLIGATTENPYFSLNNALLSRVRVLELSSLAKADLRRILQRANQGNQSLQLRPDAEDYLLEYCDGDARRLLGAVELLARVSHFEDSPKSKSSVLLGRKDVRDFLQRQSLYDRDGDYHYDTISAFIKSVRGSDVDSALDWLQVMLAGGEDPGFIWRRLLILAAEDIGLAEPQALVQVEAAASAFERVGLPEGEYFLSQACIYLALCPKSSSVGAFWKAKEHLKRHGVIGVPLHLRSHVKQKLAADAGLNKQTEGYLYPHNYRGHWVAQNYSRPDFVQKFYTPGKQGWEAGREHERRTEWLREARRLEFLQKQGLLDAGDSHELLLLWDELRTQFAQFGRRWSRLVICGERLTCSGQTTCSRKSDCDNPEPGGFWEIFPQNGDFPWELMRQLQKRLERAKKFPESQTPLPSPEFLHREWRRVQQADAEMPITKGLANGTPAASEMLTASGLSAASGLPTASDWPDFEQKEKFPAFVFLLNGANIEASQWAEISAALRPAKIYVLQEYSGEPGAAPRIMLELLDDLERQLRESTQNEDREALRAKPWLRALRRKLGELRRGLMQLADPASAALRGLETFDLCAAWKLPCYQTLREPLWQKYSRILPPPLDAVWNAVWRELCALLQDPSALHLCCRLSKTYVLLA